MKLSNYYIREGVNLLLESKATVKNIISRYYWDKLKKDKRDITKEDIEIYNNYLDKGKNLFDKVYNEFNSRVKEKNLIPLLILLYYENWVFHSDTSYVFELYNFYKTIKSYNLKLPKPLDYYMNYKNTGNSNSLYELLNDDLTLVVNNYKINKLGKIYVKANSRLKEYIKDSNVLDLLNSIYSHIDDLDNYEPTKLDKVTNLQEFIEYLEYELEYLDSESLSNIISEVKNDDGAIIVHKTNDLLIVQINDIETSRALGCEKTWCISFIKRNQWNVYMGDDKNTVQFFVWDYSIPKSNNNSKIAFTYDYEVKEITYAHARNDASIIPYVKNKFDTKFIDSIVDYESLYKLYPNNIMLKYKISGNEEDLKIYKYTKNFLNKDITIIFKNPEYLKYVPINLLRIRIEQHTFRLLFNKHINDIITNYEELKKYVSYFNQVYTYTIITAFKGLTFSNFPELHSKPIEYFFKFEVMNFYLNVFYNDLVKLFGKEKFENYCKNILTNLLDEFDITELLDNYPYSAHLIIDKDTQFRSIASVLATAPTEENLNKFLNLVKTHDIIDGDNVFYLTRSEILDNPIVKKLYNNIPEFRVPIHKRINDEFRDNGFSFIKYIDNIPKELFKDTTINKHLYKYIIKNNIKPYIDYIDENSKIDNIKNEHYDRIKQLILY